MSNKQVELELARRQQQQQQDNLGPAALESLLNRPSQRESQRRVPTSRVNDVSNVSPGRGRLQVRDSDRIFKKIKWIMRYTLLDETCYTVPCKKMIFMGRGFCRSFCVNNIQICMNYYI